MKITLGTGATVENATSEDISILRSASTVVKFETIMYNGEIITEPVNIFHYTGETFPIGSLYSVPLTGTEIIDNRTTSPYEFGSSTVTLWDHQKDLLKRAKKASLGVFVVHPAGGKTFLAYELIRQKKQKAVVLLHTKELAKQWSRGIKQTFGFEPGFIGDSKFSEAPITVALIQTVSNLPNIRQFFSNYGTVIFDECHHVPAEQFSKVAKNIPCKNRFGLSGTPCREDGQERAIYLYLGKPFPEVTREHLVREKIIVPVEVYFSRTEIPYEVEEDTATKARHAYINEIISDEVRNKTFILGLYDKLGDNPCLILSDRTAHVDTLYDLAIEEGLPAVKIHGKMKKSEIKKAMESPGNLTISTYQFLGEGIDQSHWRVLILATPVSSEVRLIQAIGRISRKRENKFSGCVYDLVDDTPLSWSSVKKRKPIYNQYLIPYKFI